MTALFGALGLGDAGLAQEFADADGLALLGRVGLRGAGEERELVVGESDGEHLAAGVAGDGAAGAGAHGHDVTVSQDLTLCDTADRFNVLHELTLCDTVSPMNDTENDDRETVDTSDCGSGQCDPNTGCPSCNDDDRAWVRAR